MTVFVPGKVSDSTIAIIAVGIGAPCFVVIVIAILIYCYKEKNRYRKCPSVAFGYMFVRPSVCPSHGWIRQRRLQLGSCNFHHRADQ